MTAMSTGAGMLAHTMHYALVVGGLLTLAVVLLPHALRRLGDAPAGPLDAHDLRVLELRARASEGTLALAVRPTAPPRADAGRPRPLSVGWLPVVASGAAAAIHAGAGPGHLAEHPLFGAFFIGVALGQLCWAALAATWCTPRLLLVGVVGNAAVLLLWLTTRLWGLPLGLMPEPEAVGAWDLACAGWEILVVVTCVRLLTARRRTAVAS